MFCIFVFKRIFTKYYDYSYDFEDCVREMLAEHGLKPHFDFGVDFNNLYKFDPEKYTKFILPCFYDYTTPSNACAIRIASKMVDHGINYYLQESSEKVSLYIQCCESAMEIVTKAWDGVFITR